MKSEIKRIDKIDKRRIWCFNYGLAWIQLIESIVMIITFALYVPEWSWRYTQYGANKNREFQKKIEDGYFKKGDHL